MKKVLFLAVALMLFVMSVEARQPRRGYRGFVEWSSSVRSETYASLSDDNRGTYRRSFFYTGFATSHGYQINPVFFIGAGVGLERSGKFDIWIAPLFLQTRADLRCGKFTPFGDLRIGFNSTDGGGIYFSPTVGYRFNWGRKVGVNLGAGMTLVGYKAEIYRGEWTGSDGYIIQHVGSKHCTHSCFTFRLGFDF